MSARTLAISAAVVLAAVAMGWRLSAPSRPAAVQGGSASAAPAASASAVVSAPAKAGAPAVKPGAWVPPTGDPVQRFKAATTSAERIQVISDFITLGHDRNVFMLQEALKDSDPKVRMLALESAASMLTPEMAREVYRVSAVSEDPDIRTMTWSFVAPHPMENRVAVYREALAGRQDVAAEEALAEMGRTPEMPLFEMMLGASLTQNLPAGRNERLLKELNEWLKPGGGEVPEFHSPAELMNWWQANHRRYDQYMLRVDQ